MRLAMAATAMAVALTVSAFAQGPPARRGAGFRMPTTPAPTLPPSGAAPAQVAVPSDAPTPPGAQPPPGTLLPARDAKVYKDGEELPDPSKVELTGPTIALPTDPLDKYLVTKDCGPFMVLGHTFRGPEAAKFAQALTIELRRDFQLPAYVYYLRMKPGRSNIRGVQPTSEPFIPDGEMNPRAHFRMYDEAAVLIGNCKTIADAKALMIRVKKLSPQTLAGVPNPYPWRKGLKGALITTNPYAAAQKLFPGQTFDPTQIKLGPKPIDPLVKKMNSGKRSIFKCPGEYTMPVAEFNGRATLYTGRPDVAIRDEAFKLTSYLKKSPLATAESDAHELADLLAKNDDIRKAGVEPYVYHDRTSSKVTLGAFGSPDDPRADRLREVVMKVATDFQKTRKLKTPLSVPTTLMAVTRP